MIGLEQNHSFLAPLLNDCVIIVLGQRSHWRATLEVLSFESLKLFTVGDLEAYLTCDNRVRLSDKRKMLVELPCSAKIFNQTSFAKL